MSMMKLVVVAVVAGALAFPGRFARADTGPELKSGTTATALSIGGTLASVGVFAFGEASGRDRLAAAGLVGALIAPSAGEMYAGDVLTVGMGLRAVGIGALIGGYEVFMNCNWSCSRDSGNLIIALLTTSIVGYGAGAVYDIATAQAAVERHNQRIQLQIAPMVSTPSGPAAGLSLGGSF